MVLCTSLSWSLLSWILLFFERVSVSSYKVNNIVTTACILLTLTLPGPSAGVSGSLDSYCSLKALCSGMGEVVPARTSPTLLPYSLALCCHYPVSKCRSASIAVTGTVRVNCGKVVIICIQPLSFWFLKII